jgi:prepilin-type N-terminal cleavage/methylation domain-containing protein
MSRSKGFTIVELLIVIVVIGILAAITIVSYSGIQLRARVVSVQADLGNLNKQMELFKIENDTYPATATDVEKVLRSARLYENTRLSAADEAAGKQPSRSFVFCMKKNTQSFAIVSFAPISTFLVANGASHVGEPLYYVSSEFSGTKTLQWDASLNTGSNLCTSVSPTYNVLNDRYIVWSFSVPTPNAP